jgi:hypothetical protein
VRPAVARAATLSESDRRAVTPWHRRRKLFEIRDRFEKKKAGGRGQPCAREPLAYCSQRSDDCGYFLGAVEEEINDLLNASTLALGASLIVAHLDCGNEHLRPLFRAALAAIRPQLIGAIAEDADRALVEDGQSSQRPAADC